MTPQQPGGGFGLMWLYNGMLAFERWVRRQICAVLGHDTTRAIGDFDEATCRRCRETISTPDARP